MSFHFIKAAWALQGISPTERLVLLALVDHADPTGRCWPSQSRLARMTGLSERTISRVISKLESKKLIKRRHRFERKQRTTHDEPRSDLFTILLNPDTVSGIPRHTVRDYPDKVSGITPTQNPSVPDTESNKPITEPVNGNKQTKHSPKQPGAAREDVRGLFEEFWKAYPTREGDNPKHLAEVQFEQQVKAGVDPSAIIDGAKRYAAFAQKIKLVREPRFIPMTHRWLERHGWEDEHRHPDKPRSYRSV